MRTRGVHSPDPGPVNLLIDRPGPRHLDTQTKYGLYRGTLASSRASQRAPTQLLIISLSVRNAKNRAKIQKVTLAEGLKHNLLSTEKKK